MKLLAVHPDLTGWASDGPDLRIILDWLTAAGHTVQTLVAHDVDKGFDAFFDGLLSRERPDVVLAVGVTMAGLHALQRARTRDTGTVLMLWHEAASPCFAHADRVLVPNDHLRRCLRATLGVVAEAIPLPLSTMPAPLPDEEGRAFLGFVGPAPWQGASVFARVAARLAAERPDIPMLLMQSPDATAEETAALAASLDPATQAQVVACPAVPEAELFAMTRLLLLPAVADPGAARLAAAAGWHGVPVVASDQGALPELVGAGGVVLPLPPIVLSDARLVPGEAETQAWVDAVVQLWDDEAAHAAAAQAGRDAAAARHDPTTLADRYCRFFMESY